MQYKHLTLDSANLKFDRDGRKFSGYASVFGEVDAYNDSIVPGAYKDTIQNRERPIRMRWNHYGPVIGKWVHVEEDEKGLWVEGELTRGHSVADDVYASMVHGAVDGMSIGYRVRDSDEESGITYLKEIDLVEISVVEEPADLGAMVAEVKHHKELIDQIDSLKEAEHFLRESGGLSRAAATSLVSRVRSMVLGDREPESKSDFNEAFKGINRILDHYTK